MYTAAQKLLNNLKMTKNYSHVYLFGSYDEAMDKQLVIKIRKKKKKELFHETMEDCDGLTKEMKNQVKNVVKGLDLGDGKLLLAVVWVAKESKVIHMKFPWLLGRDDTFQINAEKRPLAQLCGMNTTNESLTFVNDFIPSAQKWFFIGYGRVLTLSC